MIIYIGSDHGGYEMKNFLVQELAKQGLQLRDLGADRFDPDDDYPDKALAVAQAVATDQSALGILLCRSGQGVCIVANKVNGVRAALAWNEEVAAAARKDDHVNVLCLPADFITKPQALEITHRWLQTKPGQEDRFLRRLSKLKTVEDS